MEYMEITKTIGRVVLKYETCDFKDELWSRIEAHCTDESHTRVISLRRTKLLWSIAASVAIMLGLGWGSYTFCEKSYTATGSELAVVLPDNSTATLDAGSSLKYNRIGWLLRRNVSLGGKALFAGEHGKGFKVITPEGTIAVLGTEFLVAEQTGTLHVECLSGSVLVEAPQGEQILHQAEQVTFDENGMHFSKIWPEYESCDNLPLSEVVQLIEEIYGISIEGVDKYSHYTYSGVIPTTNMEMALELVFDSCNIKYTVSDGTAVLF